MSTDPNENVKQLGQTYSFQTGQDFADDEQQTKKDRVDDILKESNKLQDDVRNGYYLMSTPSEPTWLGTGYLYDKAFEILNIIAHQLENEGEDDLAAKFRAETQRVADQLVDPNLVTQELDRSVNQLNHPSERLETIQRKYSNQMRQFANWVFTGTIATKESEDGPENMV